MGKGLGGGGGGKKGNDPPPAPNYVGAANATSQGSIQAALANNLLNLRNTTSPLGSQSFHQTGTQTIPGVGDQPAFDIPTYDQQITMSPEQQGLYNQQMGLSQGLLGLGQGSLDQTSSSLQNPIDMNALPSRVSTLSQGSFQGGLDPSKFDRDQVINSLYGQQTSRLDPQWAQRDSQMKTQLANQGLAPGGEAYTNAMRDENFARNDAYNSALNSAISNATGQQQAQFGMELGKGQFTNQAEQARLAQQQQAGAFQDQARAQGLQEQIALRQQPLTELNAIRTGAQPQMPQFQPVPTAGGAQGPNLLGATQAQGAWDQGLYNTQVGQQNSKNSGLMGIGSAAAMYF